MCILVLGCLGIVSGLRAQARSIRFERLSLEEGLSQGTVNCVLQDNAGYLWLGTQDGLNRYDGYEFQVYKNDPTDPRSLPSSWINALAEDLAGDLWVGTKRGLARWSKAVDSFERYQNDRKSPANSVSDQVRALVVDQLGDLWVGTLSSGLMRIEVKGASGNELSIDDFRHDPSEVTSLSGDRIRSLYEDRNGNLWIGTLSGLNRFDRDSGSFVQFRHDPADVSSLSDDGVLSVLEDHAGNLWVGTENGLNRFHDEGFVRYSNRLGDPTSLSHDRVRVLFEDIASRLWVGTDGGLNMMVTVAESDNRTEAVKFVRYLQDAALASGLSSDRVMSISQDRGGVLWIGTQGGGINKFDPRTWAFGHHKAEPANPEGLSGSAVFAFSEDAGGRLWVGSLSGLDVLDRETERFTRYRHQPSNPSSLPGHQISVLHHDREGYLWVGAIGHDLARYDPRTQTFRRFQPDPERPDSGRVVTSLYEDLQGELWIGTFRMGLDRYDRENGTFVHFRNDPEQPASLSDNQINAFTEDAAGHLWVGTHNGGLNRFDRRSENFHHVRHDPARPSSLSSDTVLALHVDAAGVLWVGTQAGLNRLESLGREASFEHFREADGLPNNVVSGIQPDSTGGLWLSTNNGLSRFDPVSGTFRNFKASHGLQSNEFNFNAHYRSRSGELFFGGVNGFNAFFPDQIEPNPHVPPVVLTSFTKLNKPVRFDRPLPEVEEIALDHGDDFFSVEVAALDFAAPEQNRYRYMLEGFNSDWVDIGHRRRMSFTNLDAGSYTLWVQGSNNDGVWNEEGARIRIRVAPAPWATWWAYSLYVLALAAAIGASVRHHHLKIERERSIAGRERAQSEERRRLLGEREALIEELEAKNIELERFNYTVSHDLKSPLVTIKGFLRLLEKDAASGEAERLKRDVRRIAAAADRMSRLLDELLELSRVGRMVRPPEEIRLAELASEALELSRGHAGNRIVDVLIDPELPVVFGDRLRLLQLYQNLLANAFKYMGEQLAPMVEVGSRRGRRTDPEGVSLDDTVLFVEDNGIGIEARYHEKVFGLFERLDVVEDGTGIGLALAKRIVEIHGGRIWVESEGRGCGSSFCFTLPDSRRDAENEGRSEGPGTLVNASHRFRKWSLVD